MIATYTILVGGLLAIITSNNKFLFVAMALAIIVIALKQQFHGYEIQKLKGHIDA